MTVLKVLLPKDHEFKADCNKAGLFSKIQHG